jgi:hypothetical protein
MSLKMRVDVYESLPPGQYTAKLKERKEMPASQKFPDAGPSFAWEFEVADGEHVGKSASAWTPTRLTSQNNLGKLVSRMLGRPMRSGEEIDLDDFIGKLYSIIVDQTQDGTRTKVISAQPIVAGQPVAPAQARVVTIPPRPAAPPPAAPPVAPPPAAPPVAPPPPAAKVFAQSRADFKIAHYWCYVSIRGEQSVEMLISDVKKLVASGTAGDHEVVVYLIDEAAWMPLSVVDLPF